MVLLTNEIEELIQRKNKTKPTRFDSTSYLATLNKLAKSSFTKGIYTSSND
jgi:hypothetical protein